MLELHELPRLNALLNGTAAALMLSGYLTIRLDRRRVRLHATLMTLALAVSATFLASYLYYHFSKTLVTRFTAEGTPRTVYLSILISHSILAVAVVPLVLTTFYRALRGQWQRHARVARWTLPTWLYVSVTGVLVYLMLYVWYPPSAPPLL